jgi:hypothetical protein
MSIETITFHFVGQLEDSGAIVDVQCQIDEDGDCRSLDSAMYQGINVLDVISHDQWENLQWEGSKKYKTERDTQAGIDYENSL